MNEFSAHEIKIVKHEFEKYAKSDTNPEQLKKTEKFFDRILKNNNAIKLLVDVNTNKIVKSNQYAQEFYGFSEDELHNKEIFDINALNSEEVKEEYQRAKEQGRDYFEGRQKKSSGEIKKVMVRSTPLKIEDRSFMYLIIHEMETEEEENNVEVQEERTQVFSLFSNNEESMLDVDFSDLEQNAKNLVELSNKLAESEDKLQKLNASKDRFFSIISNDLKNSFFYVMGLSKILADPENDDSEEKKLETAQMLHNSSKKLYSFLENLLSWARVQRGEIEYEPEENDLFEISSEVAYLFSAKAEQSEIIIKNYISENTNVFCDANMINTVFRNLISNALNFTSRNGMITLDARTKEEEVEIIVADTGIGISEANIKKLLRIDSKYIGTNVQGEKGTGLGLILCSEFVEKHNGKIWIESELGKGSKFHFTIPRKN